MLPMVDDFLQMFIVEKLRWLKAHPKMIEHIFFTGRRETLKNLRTFIEEQRIRVIIGYPRDQTSLPCYVINLAPENEQPIGLGDDLGFYRNIDYLGSEGDAEHVEQELRDELSKYVSSTFMNCNYRIECWSDNGDMTAYLYILLKWCIWSSRIDMVNLGWVNITLSGTDLEPVPEYMPVFIFRRALQINLLYENKYYENLDVLGNYVDVLDNPDKYHEDENGNIVDDEGNIVLPEKDTWVLRAHYYQKLISARQNL